MPLKLQTCSGHSFPFLLVITNIIMSENIYCWRFHKLLHEMSKLSVFKVKYSLSLSLRHVKVK